MRTQCHHRVRGKGEEGAALIEFALIFPIFMVLVLGMISGGVAYNQKLSMTNAGREAARYGATLSVGSFAGANKLNQWLDAVANTAVTASTSQLPASAPGRKVCVAYISPGDPNTLAQKDTTFRRQVVGSAAPVYSGSPCYNDGRPAGERRVQVVLERLTEIDLLFDTIDTVLLSATASAHFEPKPIS